MPIVPSGGGSVYDSVTTVLNMTRTRVAQELKTLQPTNGKVLEQNQATTLQMFNTAWRKSQEFLADKGYSALIGEVLILSFPIVASTDPAIQCWLSWSGCSDGVNEYAAPALPEDFSHPLKMFERWSNINAEFVGPPMEKCLDGIPSTVKTSVNRFWEWRGNAIWIPGSQMVEDFRIRYVKFLPDFADINTTFWWTQTVPIVRVADGLSWMLCAEMAAADGKTQVHATCTAKGEAALMKVMNLDVKADQRVNVRRQPRAGRGYGRGSWQ